MKLTVDVPGSANLVRAYTAGGFRIGQRDCAGSVIVSAQALIENWRPRDIADLVAGDLEPALALEPEVLLIGTGASQAFPTPELLAALYRAKVGFEIMNTGAACRTYNVMLAEGRAVVAALLPERR
jgi:uncharacterized protein